MSNSMKDAFLKTKKGEKIVMAANLRHAAKADRIRQLKTLVHDTFVANVPEGYSKRWDVYQRSKDTVKKLGLEGGEPYRQAVFAVKFAFTDRKNYKLAMEALGC